MLIATSYNYRTTYEASESLARAFDVAYKAGLAMGFSLVSIALLVLTLLIVIYSNIKDVQHNDRLQLESLFEGIAGYGLGGSFVALFGRVGGGIYTKAADVGADLVGKVEKDLPEDSYKNPATIADNVGDNVGDVAGMGADLFGSFAESTCAALVVSASSLFDTQGNTSLTYLLFPLVLMALCIPACILTSMVAVFINNVDRPEKIERTLKIQLLLSTLLSALAIIGASFMTLPSEFVIDGSTHQRLEPFYCSLAGLVSGFVIGAVTEYVTSYSYDPVKELADSCRHGPATNIIFGLALGYLSTLVPVCMIGATAWLSLTLLGYYGVALAALGMLANLPISLAIDGYGPISDNAGGIAEMAELSEATRDRTDALDAAGNTTAAIGKGFAIGSAALVALALYGGFRHIVEGSAGHIPVDIATPLTFLGLIVGAMLPYLFSAFTMKSVGKAAQGMVNEVRRQIEEQPGILTGSVRPDYRACVRISTQESLKEMIAPGLLVVATPIISGLALGPLFISGLLPGSLVSGVQLAISAANTGGAWDNAKKYIESGNMYTHSAKVLKGSDIHKAAVVGDTVGDPLKDTSGPSLNILVKLLAIISLVFAEFFVRLHSGNV